MESGWQQGLREAFRDPKALAEHLSIPLDLLPPLPSEPSFPFLVPRPFARRMRPRDPADPLLRQVWPDRAEASTSEGERDDPVGDAAAELEPGLLRKYEGRALVVATGSCAVHCRYCFRQNFPYGEAPPADWTRRLERLRTETDLRECILSGGDPLTLTDSVLSERIQDLTSIPHLSTLRIHTRLPVVLPDRVTSELLGILSGTRLRTVVVLHANHPAEIDDAVAVAAAALRSAGVQLLNQSVLLAGVNDDASCLESLSLRLWEAGILPYYLHALDPVRGSARFAVPDDRARILVREVQARLPGYLVPRLVREIPGAPSKTPL
ncbi:MAG TPA: EF-P beta-lysylation protein EpmB [Fibrobacteria bacterium]|nr:EF-P beta-lysylation protein EpmB [Fibrobacteria bacterium]